MNRGSFQGGPAGHQRTMAQLAYLTFNRDKLRREKITEHGNSAHMQYFSVFYDKL